MSTKLHMAVGERDHQQGAFDAKVTLVEYGDYQCHYCGLAYPIVKAIQRRLGDDLRFVYRNFPLREMHRHAQEAAEAAEAAGAQGRFWEMHDVLFENQGDLGHAALRRYAQQVQTEAQRWDQDMHRHAFSDRVQEDFLSGVRGGVNGTPTFFINGYRHDGPFDEESLLLAIELAARHAGL